jgi:hypothetical protein
LGEGVPPFAEISSTILMPSEIYRKGLLVFDGAGEGYPLIFAEGGGGSLFLKGGQFPTGRIKKIQDLPTTRLHKHFIPDRRTIP